jgi:geranylgeranyl pyrophosphate synthase
MVRVAAEGHRQLCRGQGAELCWARQPSPLSQQQVLDIFRKKTAPAFEVALRLGALYSEGCRSRHEEAHTSSAGTGEFPEPGSYEEIETVLATYSEALGIAYQIRDDLSDLGSQGETNDIAGLRPSLLLAIAYEKAKDANKALLESVWGRSLEEGVKPEQIESLYLELKADERARQLYETYKEEAIRSLRDVENPNLKGLLRRVIGKIFNDTEIKGWCKEFEQKNAARRAVELAPG